MACNSLPLSSGKELRYLFRIVPSVKLHVCMERSVRISLFALCFAIILFLAGSARQSLAFSPPISAFGNGEINGPVSLRITTNPTIVQPGEEFDLQLTLVNATRSTYTPAIKIELPSTVELATTTLPSGMTVNYQSGHLDWLPLISGSNGRLTYSLRVRAMSANIQQPEQAVRATMSIDDQSLAVESRFWLGTAPFIETIRLPAEVAIGQPVQLRAEIMGSGPFTQRWQLSDGRTLDVNDPEVLFSTAGEVEVTLTAVNPLSSASRTRTIRVVPKPSAQFILSDFTVGQNQPVEFINQSGGLGPLQTIWEFGDGSSSTATKPAHTYAEPGVYQVRLTVVNQYGRSEAYGSVTVGAAPAIELNLPERVAAGQPIQGSASGDDSITRYQWDFGDGQMVDGRRISSTFNSTGDYYVTLTAFNEFGQTSVGQWVTVEPGNLLTYLPRVLQTDPQDVTVVSVARPVVQGGAGEGLPDVPLDEPFVMTPLDLPASMTMTEQLFVYVNEARRQFGLRPLTEVPTLSAAAQEHVIDMARNKYTGHIGSDGSAPIERFVQFQYSGGYAGEATAWGFEHPYQAVEFWVNSPGHRKIILNEFATDLGVGYTVDLRSPSVWYWTTEYGNRFELAYTPTIRIQEPLGGTESRLNSELMEYGWVWPVPLAENQQFDVYAAIGDEPLLLGQVTQPRRGIYYALNSDWMSLTHEVGDVRWWVELTADQQPIASSEPNNLTFVHDELLPTVTPTAVPTQPPTPVLPTATPTPFIPTPTSPSNVAPPPLATATPEP